MIGPRTSQHCPARSAPPPGKTRALAGLALLVSGVYGCRSDDGTPASSAREWQCGFGVQGASTCSCRSRQSPTDGTPAIVASLQNPTRACQVYDCCLLQEATGSENATCDCIAGADCAAEAASRPGSTMVSQCPPEAEDASLTRACAAEGENCQYDNLRARDSRGCCPGTLCKLDSSGTLSCVAATAGEQESARQCSQFASSERLAPSRVTGGVLETNLGTLRFDKVESLDGSTGPGGCVTYFDATLQSSDNSLCAMFLDVGLIDGSLRVRSVGGLLSGCRGLQRNLAEGLWSSTPSGPPQVDVTFAGAACDPGLSFESYCVNGVFDFFFHGAAGQVIVQDSHLQVEGTWCSGAPGPSCPIPAQ